MIIQILLLHVLYPHKLVPKSNHLKNINANVNPISARIVNPLLKKEGEEITSYTENEVFNAFFICVSQKRLVVVVY